MAKKQSAEERTIFGYRYIGAGANFPGIPARDLGGVDLTHFRAAIDECIQAGTLQQLYAPVYEYEKEVSDG